MDSSNPEPRQTPPSEDVSSPFLIIEKVLNIFGWVVKFTLFAGFIVVLVYGVLTVVLAISPLLQGSSGGPFIAPPAIEAMNSSIERLDPILIGFWDLLKPILQLVVIVVLLRWLFFTQQGPLTEHIRQLDTPSLVSIFAISAIVVIALLGLNIPTGLTNIALIIVLLLLVRSLLLPQDERLPGILQRLIVDVPSAIAVLVIGTVALITVLNIEIPQALANIALVIVGFYFGQERFRNPAGRDGPADVPPKDK